METNYNGLLNDEGEIWVAGAYVKNKAAKGEELMPTYTVDQLLDQYNDNMNLYKQFGDEEYLTTANEIMVQLKTKQYIEEE